jgi:hypothetical protein
MTKFYLNPRTLEKWQHQNGAYCDDMIEGNLLDNMLLDCKNGYAALYEHYVNCWTSNYLVIFGKTQDEIREIQNEFYLHAQEAK